MEAVVLRDFLHGPEEERGDFPLLRPPMQKIYHQQRNDADKRYQIKWIGEEEGHCFS